MRLAELTTEVARRADTAPKGSTITVTDCSRVLAVLFDVLAACPSKAEAFDVIAKGMASAEKRAGGKASP